MQEHILASVAAKVPNFAGVNDSSKFDRNLLKVEIYFDNLIVTEIEESPAYDVSKNDNFTYQLLTKSTHAGK